MIVIGDGRGINERGGWLSPTWARNGLESVEKRKERKRRKDKILKK